MRRKKFAALAQEMDFFAKNPLPLFIAFTYGLPLYGLNRQLVCPARES
jgi:hypothetical protein